MTTYQGKALTFSIFGGSHEPEIGIEVRGLPAAPIDLAALQHFLDRRAPGRYPWSTTRREPDEPIFQSGLRDGALTGEPLRAVIRNQDAQSGDYVPLRDVPRPMHADFTAYEKYGSDFNMAGGGPFSGRMTAPLCILGGICLQLLQREGIRIGAHIAAIAGIEDAPFDPVRVSAADFDDLCAFPVLDEARSAQMRAAIEAAACQGDSVGGVIECAAVGLPTGLGGELTDGLESALAPLLFAIPAVKGVEFGAGFAAAELRGSEHNDAFCIRDAQVRTVTNRHGGILGGISTAMPLLFRIAVKPTPSISLPQKSVSLSRRTEETLTISGRHDPCIVPRAVSVAEAACAIALWDVFSERSRHGTD